MKNKLENLKYQIPEMFITWDWSVEQCTESKNRPVYMLVLSFAKKKPL